MKNKLMYIENNHQSGNLEIKKVKTKNFDARPKFEMKYIKGNNRKDLKPKRRNKNGKPKPRIRK